MQQNINKSAWKLAVQDTGSLSGWLASRNGLLTILIIVVSIAVLVTHWPALSAKAISFDDGAYFVNNCLVQSPGWDSARRFLTEVFRPTTVGGYYQPLTMISLMLDYALGGRTENLVQFHRTSLLLHIANTALIIVLLYQLFGRVWIAAAVGLLFGLHPLTVEPIPWVGERKTLLAAFFSLWSLVLYVRFVHKSSRKTYLGCIVMFVLALMSKPTSTPLPVMMLLMDYWPLGRLKRRTILEKLPLFVIGGISSVITLISQGLTASVIMPHKYGTMRVPMFICHNIIFYLYKMIWPVNLSSHYYFPDPLGFATPMIRVGVIGTCILIPLLVLSWRWTRAAITGWLIFFVAISPTMQVLQFSDVIASDKFAYLPSIGLLMILATFLGWVCGVDGIGRYKARCIIVAIIVLLLAGAESFATRQYLACWKDTASLFTQMIKVAPKAMPPYHNLEVALADRGDVNEAMECFKKMLELRPNNIEVHLRYGQALADQGRYDEALYHYNRVLRLKPNNMIAYRRIAVVLVDQGRSDEAIATLHKGLKYKPRNWQLRAGLGTIYLQQGKMDEAIPELQISVEQKPVSTTYNNLGVALLSKGRIDEAMECHKKAIQLDPENAEAYYNLGNILLSQDKFEQAISEYESAVRLNPQYIKAHINLGMALMEKDRFDEAIGHLAEAVKIEPGNVIAHYNLAMVLVDKGRLEEAANEYRQVLGLQPENADVHCMLGDVLVQLGRLEEATAEYREALRINPQHSQAQEGLKNVSLKRQSGQTTK
jgi:tetratricopeptide (TPR) repeat protein